jgi:hypothetical protein
MNSFQNKFNFNKSNIFNDPDKETQNRTITPLRNTLSSFNNSKSLNKSIEPQLQFIHNDMFIRDLDWSDAKTQIIFKRKNVKTNPTAKELKQMDNRGSMFTTTYGEYKHNNAKVEPQKTLEKSYDEIYKLKQLNEKQRTVDMFCIDNITNNKKFDMEKIKKIYRENGLHIFGDKTDFLYLNGQHNGKASFKVRTNNDKGDYKMKLKKAEDKIKKELGVNILSSHNNTYKK